MADFKNQKKDSNQVMRMFKIWEAEKNKPGWKKLNDEEKATRLYKIDKKTPMAKKFRR